VASATRSYFRVGVFVLVILVGIVAGVVVLGGGALFHRSIVMETYLKESVQGLDVGSPVRYRGVKIGTVKEITFVATAYDLSPSDPRFFQAGQLVVVRASIESHGFRGESGEPQTDVLRRLVENGLRVRLASQGITGTSYLEVDYLPPDRNPALQVTWVPANYYIPSAPSTISRLSTAAEQVFTRLEDANLEQIVVEATALLRELRQTNDALRTLIAGDAVKGAVGDIAAAAGRVRALAETADSMTGDILVDVRETTLRLNSFSQALAQGLPPTAIRAMGEDLRRILSDVRAAAAELPQAADSAGRALRRVDAVVAQVQQQVQSVLDDVSAAARSLRSVSEQAERYPSQILFGAPPPRGGPDR